MAERRDPNMTLQDLRRVLLRHKKKVGCFVFVVMLTVLGAVLLTPDKFVSEASLFVRVGHEAVTLDPTATMGDRISVQKTPDAEINSVVDIMESRRIAERVVDTLGCDLILKGPQNDAAAIAPQSASLVRDVVKPWVRDRARELAQRKEWLLSKIRPPSTITDYEKAVDKVMESTTASPVRGSMVILATTRSRWPDVAHRVLQTITAEFPKEYSRLNRTEGSFEFFVEQTQELSDQLANAEQQLRDQKNQFGIISVEGRRTSLERLMSDVELERFRTERSMESSQAKVSDLQEQLDGLSPTVVTATVSGLSNPARDGMRQQLYDLQIRERELLAKYSEDHFLVAAIQKQRKAVTDILDSEISQRTNTSTGPNPNYLAIELQLKSELTNLAGYRTEKESLASQSAQVREDITALNDHALHMEELQRRVDAMAFSYQVSMEKLEQARIEDELRASRISSVNVLQPATRPSEPDLSKKRLAIALGLVFAVFGSFGLAATAEAFDSRLKSANHVEFELDLPVLVCIPKVTPRRSLLIQEQRDLKCSIKPRKPQKANAAVAVLSESLTS